MASVNPTLAEVLEASQRTLAARIHVSIPAEVVSYNPVTNTIDAKLAVKDFFFDGDGERTYDEPLTFPSVLVMWPRGGGKVVRLPLEPGDTVNLLFAERSIAEWRATGQTSEPIDSRRLSYGYPVAIPGLSADVNPLDPLDAVEVTAGAMIIGEDGGTAQMIVGGTIPGVRFGKLAVSPVALAVPTDTGLAAIVASLNALVTAFNAHVHVAPGGSTNAPTVGAGIPASSAAAPASTASTLVKSV